MVAGVIAQSLEGRPAKMEEGKRDTGPGLVGSH